VTAAAELIYSLDDTCVGCNKCIRNCPIDGANIAYMKEGENKVKVDQAKCIRCGACLESCSHGARQFRDDTEDFFADLAKGMAISVVAAPAARVNFQDHRKLIAFLKDSGVRSVYDVSFGADITTWAYLKAIKEKGLDSVIAQPCPAIVNYIEKFRPALLGRLAPVHSPTLCTAVYMRDYAKIKDRIAFISPCIGKADEFRDPNTKGYVSYNVTYAKLRERLDSKKIDLSRYQGVDFDDIGCWLGCVYSRPGGLRENVEQIVKGAWVRQIEGQVHAYPYLREYEGRLAKRRSLPLLVDILNCANGCNRGTATMKDVEIDDADERLNNLKAAKLQEKGRLWRKKREELFGLFDRSLDLKSFMRAYSDKSSAEKEPGRAELDSVFRLMHKDSEESRKVDCSACGYDSCQTMAKAIISGFNNKGNCIDFNRHEIALENESIGDKTKVIEQLSSYTNKVVSVLDSMASLNLDVGVDGSFDGEFSKIKDSINRIIQILNSTLLEIKAVADEFDAGARQVADGGVDLAEGTNRQAEAVQTLSELIGMLGEKTRANVGEANAAFDLSSSAKAAAEEGNRKMGELLSSMREINAASENTTTILKTIDDIAFQTNILALNAAVEAARVGKYGKGFAVVADEVRNLANKCSNAAKESAKSIRDSVEKARKGTEIAASAAKSLGDIVGKNVEIAHVIERIMDASNEQASGIVDVEQNVHQVSQVVQANAAVSEESASTSEELSQRASSLKECVSRFTLRAEP
jgi:methyl-accepting chemotaxis protein/NAD-dependent dihydropyrimidine dehydrogenase PreA subunit